MDPKPISRMTKAELQAALRRALDLVEHLEGEIGYLNGSDDEPDDESWA